MNRGQLKNAIAKKFPNIWMKDSEEFDGTQKAIWTGEGSDIDGVPAFGVYNEGYVFGVHPELHKFLESKGWYTEAYDPGTFFIFKI